MVVNDDAYCLNARGALRLFASRLAMDVNHNACIQNARSGLRFFASRLAPTVR
jgi:hypothetical protein